MKDEALSLMKTDGVQAAVEFLKTGEDVIAVMDGFNHVGLACYNDLKDVAQAVDVFETGIAYGEAAAGELTGDQRYEVMSKVKGLNYNLGANTWVGWGDDASISDELVAHGALAAQRNLNLAIELEKGDLPLSRAYWLVAAHELASGAFDAAMTHFEKAVSFAEAAEAQGDALLNQGYVLLTRTLTGEDVDAEWTALLAEIKPLEYCDFFVSQLETARKIFAG